MGVSNPSQRMSPYYINALIDFYFRQIEDFIDSSSVTYDLP